MTTLVEVVYPSIGSYMGPAQLDLGPYPVPDVNKLLRVEFHGKYNLQTVLWGNTSVNENPYLWSVQWVPHGTSPSDCVTTPDGVQWIMRRQVGSDETATCWSNATLDSYMVNTYSMDGEWAGQLAIGASIDLYFSSRAPTGVGIGNVNMFGSLRFWWT